MLENGKTSWVNEKLYVTMMQRHSDSDSESPHKKKIIASPTMYSTNIVLSDVGSPAYISASDRVIRDLDLGGYYPDPDLERKKMN